MTPEEHTRLSNLFARAIERPAENRAAYVRAECVDDPTICARVLAMLREHDRPSANLDAPALDGIDGARLDALRTPVGAAAHPEIPGYTLLDVIGSGGMGTVCRAEQHHPRRLVAIKVLSSPVRTEASARRHEREAHILGRLAHPNIAHVYDAGTVGSGATARPWFSMELIDGAPLGEYAERCALDVGARVQLMAVIGDAVEHAHRAGIIHRDLKPANVLVTEDGIPRVLDFGVARLLDPEAGVPGDLTADGQLVGTIAYMSPEQVRGNDADIDAQCDVHALGAMLFELLSGALPHDLHDLPLPRALRVISEAPPRRLRDVAPSLRGDLDTIVARALEPDRAQRYPSVAALVADLRAWLDHRPIHARPPSKIYRLRRFVRRHRPLVAAVAGIILALAAGLVVSTAYGIEARARAREAQEALNVANAINDFLHDDLLELASPEEMPDPDVRLRHVLDLAAARARERFADAPAVRAELLRTLGSSYSNLGTYERAELLLDDAITTARDAFGPDDPRTLAAMRQRAVLHARQDQPHDAAALARQTVAGYLRVVGADDRRTQYARQTLARILIQSGQHDEARAIVRDLERYLGDDRHALAVLSLNATLARDAGDWATALDLDRELERRTIARHGERTTFMVRARHGLCRSLRAAGRLDAAIELGTQLVADSQSVYGADHPYALATRADLAACLRDAQRFAEAETLLETLIADRTRRFGADHAGTIAARGQLAAVLIDLDRLEDATIHSSEVVAWRTARYGAHDPRTLTSLNNLATLFIKQDRLDDAVPILERTIDGFRASLGPDHANTLGALYNLASIHERRGEYAAALPRYDALIAAGQRTQRTTDWRYAAWLGGRGRCRMHDDQFDHAERDLLDAHAIMTRAFDTPNTWTTSIDASLVELYEAWNRPAEAQRFRSSADTAPSDGA